MTYNSNKWRLGMALGAALCLVHSGMLLADDATSVTVTVGPNADKGIGYGTFEGAKILTLTITPERGKIVTSECTDNAGTNLWYLASESQMAHVWNTTLVQNNPESTIGYRRS